MTHYIKKLGQNVLRHYELYLMILPVVIYYIIFLYIPMYGVQIAFRDYYPGMGFTEAEWVGIHFFSRFFSSWHFNRLIINTLRLSLMGLVFGAPFPIILAIMLNEVRHSKFKKIIQTISYAPHFISVVALTGMILLFFSTNGIVNVIRILFGQEAIQYMQKTNYFPWIYVLSGIWQSVGFGSIIYMAALAAVDIEQYESAWIDGANKFQKIVHIDIPVLIPTFIILTILNCGRILSVGWEKTLMLQNSLNLATSEIISTYTYKVGLLNTEYSFSSAIGLFNSLINLILLISVNTLARKISDTSLW